VKWYANETLEHETEMRPRPPLNFPRPRRDQGITKIGLETVETSRPKLHFWIRFVFGVGITSFILLT